jgi:hypothetical protein
MEIGHKIDLKKRYVESDKNALNGWTSFTTGELSESSLDELAVIADKLEKIGVTLEITRKKNSDTGIGYDFVVLKVNEEKYHAAISRHAGRTADFEGKYDTYGKCTVAELQEKLLSDSKTKIAQELGCSRMTLYRIIKNINLRNPAGDTSIWHYTS